MLWIGLNPHQKISSSQQTKNDDNFLHPEVEDKRTTSTTEEQEMNSSPGSFTSSIVVALAYLVPMVATWSQGF